MAFNHVFQLFPAEFFKNTGQKECLSFKTGAFELYFFLFRLELQAMDTQPVKERQVTRIPEEFQQTIGNAVADLGNSDEFVETCGFQVVQVSEVSGQFAGDSFSYITDAQATKHSLKGLLLRFFNALETIADRKRVV